MEIVLLVLVVIFIVAFVSHKEKTYVPNHDKKQKNRKTMNKTHFMGSAGCVTNDPFEFNKNQDK